MKAIGLPPSDSRFRQMNEAQWLWCYFNVQKDQEEEEKIWKARLDYLGWYVDPEKAMSVAESDKDRNVSSSKGPSIEERGDRFIIKHGVYDNSDFEIEAKAASLGYEPTSGITAREFLEKYYAKEKENIDVMNDDFETLLKSGQFKEVSNDNAIGNPRENENDFIARAFTFEQMAHESVDKVIQNKQIPIGIDSEEEFTQLTEQHKQLFNNLLNENPGTRVEEDQNISKQEELLDLKNLSKEELKRTLEKYGLTEDDIDFIETPGDSE